MSVMRPQSETGIRTGVESSESHPAPIGNTPGALGRLAAGVRISRLVYPALLVVVAIGLSAAGVSGTSIGVLTATQLHGKPDPALLAGTPRPIRSDEWNVATPLIVAQSHHGYPRMTEDGIGEHDLSVLLDVPNTDWSTFFRPWDIPTLALDVEHGFAARWWLMSLILLLGAYLLLLALTDRTDIAILFSLGLWLSPFFHWWYLPIALEPVGMGMFALGAFLYSLRAPSTARRVAWLAVAAYSTVGFTLVFYPPFQIPTALVLGVVGISYVMGCWGELSLTWRRLVIDLGSMAVVIGATLLVFYVHSRSTIIAVNSTVYPGQRRVTGGDTSLMQLLSAPFGLSLARHGASLTSANTNQSEISSFVLLGPFVLLQLQRVRLREFTRRWRFLLAGTAVVFVVITIWYLVSLPPIVARILLLDRVPPGRALVGVGVAGILLMALFCAAEFENDDDVQPGPGRRRRSTADDRNRRLLTGALVCAGVAFGLYFWAGRGLMQADPALGLSLWKAGAVSAAVAVVVFLTSARRVILGGVALVLFGASISLPANPLYEGLGPLTSSPLLTSFTREASDAPDATHREWLSFAGSNIDDILIASGVPTLNAVDFYPNAKTWKILDPHDRYSSIWNRYANVYFSPAPTGSPPTLTLVQADVVSVSIDPCGSAAGQLGVGFVVSPTALTAPCLDLAVPGGGAGQRPYIYRRSSLGGR